MSKGYLHDFAILVLETGARPAEILILEKADVNLEQESATLPGAKTLDSKRNVPLTQEALEPLRRRTAESPNDYIFSLRRLKTKNNQGVGYVTSLKKARGDN